MTNMEHNLGQQVNIVGVKYKNMENIIWSKEDWERELKIEEPYDFGTFEEAEIYYEENINSNSNNMNPEFERARDAWLETVTIVEADEM